MRSNLIEESYECVEAINAGDISHTREELGDVFLLATMIAYMHEQAGDFLVADSLVDISAKLIRRHPHVFGEATAKTSEEVLSQWQNIKVHVEGRQAKDSVLDEVSQALPPLERAFRLQKKAAKVGFDWTSVNQVWEKAREELAEAEDACQKGDLNQIEAEMGDVLFSAINLCRFLKVDPAIALHRTIIKFDSRFRHVEKSMRNLGLPMEQSQFAHMDELWEEAKARE
jgi:tetrapyrrole methylase family protein/MazG family protein